MPSIVKTLKGKSGKTVRVEIFYDPQMDVLTNKDGSPVPDVLSVDGTKVDIRRFKEKWKKELQGKTGTSVGKPKTHKAPVAPFLKEDLTTAFEELPEIYDILYEGLTYDELSRCRDTYLVSQLSANLKYGSFSKKDLFALCDFSELIRVSLRAREADRSAFEKARDALAKALKTRPKDSPLVPTGMIEVTMDIASKQDRYKQVMAVLNALMDVFPTVMIYQVRLCKVQSDHVDSIAFDTRKRKDVCHHFA